MDPVIKNFNMEEGRVWRRLFYIKDSNGGVKNLIGWQCHAQVRPAYGSTTLLATFTTSISVTYGSIVLSLQEEETQDIADDLRDGALIDISSTTTARNLVWDMMLTNNAGLKENYVKGIITFYYTVTDHTLST